jgi:hypothetical protein
MASLSVFTDDRPDVRDIGRQPGVLNVREGAVRCPRSMAALRP